jgi:hypothetical protein
LILDVMCPVGEEHAAVNAPGFPNLRSITCSDAEVRFLFTESMGGIGTVSASVVM